MDRQTMTPPENLCRDRRNPAARAGLLLALLLTLSTGLLVGQLRTLGNTRPISVPARSEEETDASLVTAFYDAMNQVIVRGEVVELREILSADFVDHFPFGRVDGNSGSLEQYLISLHQRIPEAYLEVTDVTSEGALVATRLRLAGKGTLQVAGLPLNRINVDSYELLRFEEGQVVERWGSPELPPLVESLGAFQLGLNSNRLREPRIERVTFDSQAVLTVPSHSGIVLVVESGSVQLTTHGRSVNADRSLENGTSVSASGNSIQRLSVGDTSSIPPDEQFRISNSSSAPAVLMWLSVQLLDPATVGASHAVNPVPGVTIEFLAGGAVSRADGNPLAFVAERLISPPGTVIDVHEVANTEIVLVASGSVQVDIRDGLALRVVDGGAITVHDESFGLLQHQAISLSGPSELGYRTSGETLTELWVITLGSLEPEFPLK